MEGIRASVMAVCTVSAAICLAEQLMQGTRLRTPVQLILRLVLAAVIMMPFAGVTDVSLPDIAAYTFDEEDLYGEELYLSELKRLTEENLADSLMEELTAEGIKCGKITPEINISQDGGISIIRVVLAAGTDEGAAEVIRRSLGADTEVVYETD